jgi:4-amino-4-deoxy-L-arabinose transferase-like glycosyltransferase
MTIFMPAFPENWTVWGVVFLAALVLNLAGLWSIPLTDRDEAYYAEVSREMLEQGDFLLPHFNEKRWLEKPPLLYWLQAAAFAVFGENEFAVRLPSALAGAGTATAVFGFALSLFRCRRVALRSSLICATTPAILIASKIGMTDMVVVFFTTISTWAGWELFAHGHGKWSRRAWWLVFYAGAGIGILAKGPVGLLPLLAMGVFVLWFRPPHAISTLKPFSGLLVAMGIAACWFVPANIASQGALVSDFFGVHVIGRALSPSNGHGLSGLLGYLALVPLYLLLALPAFFP